MKTILIIDDEESVRYSFQKVFEDDHTRVVTATTAIEGVAAARELDPDVILLDLQLPDRTGLSVFEDLLAMSPTCPVIFITAHGTTQSAIEAMKRGAFDYLVKPIDLDRLSQVIRRALDAAQLTRIPAILPDSEPSDQIIGRSQVMQEMSKAIGRAAPQDLNVLILGESGTGKELVARALWRHSRRANRPFLAINCAAIPESLLESELFGHEKGAFTGADRQRVGKFEQCAGGTLLLDEIGDMPLSLQAKILRILQDNRFERVGGNETVEASVRILAATNQDLPQLVAAGKFRKDILFRLNAVTIQLPPLRERTDDIAELANHFLFRYDREMGMDLRGFSPEAMDLLQAFAWPGNVRELQGVIKQAMLNSSGHLILPEFLAERLHRPMSTTPTAVPIEGFNLLQLIESAIPNADGRLHEQVIAAVERVLFSCVLEYTHGHQARASQMLGLNRSTLRHRLKTLGLAVEKTPVDAAENPPPG